MALAVKTVCGVEDSPFPAAPNPPYERLISGVIMGPSIVVLARNPELAQSLAGGLRIHFRSVHLTHSRDEFREKVANSRPEAVVLDIEHSRLSDVESLHHDFPEIPIVCTHRIPDEEMWRAALEVGASDVCAADDVANVLTSVLRNVSRTHIAAA